MRESFVGGLLAAAVAAAVSHLFSESGAWKLAASISSIALLLTIAKPLVSALEKMPPLLPRELPSIAAESSLDFGIVQQQISARCTECLAAHSLPAYPVQAELHGSELKLVVIGADPALQARIRELLQREFSAAVVFSDN